MTLARRAVLVLAAGHCLAMVDRNLLAVAATPVASAMHLRDGALGLMLGAAFAVPYAVAAIPLGRLADRGRHRALLIGGVALWTLASLLTGLGATAGQLIGARLLLGIGQAAFVPAALALLTRGEAVSGRLAVFTGASPFGRSLALLAGGAILGLLAGTGAASWRWLFVVTAAPNLLLVAALAIVRLPEAVRLPQRIAVRRGGRRWLFLLAACAPIVAGQAGIAWMPTLIVRLHGLTPATAGVVVGSITLVAAPAGQLLGGWLARRWPVLRDRPLIVVAAGLWTGLPALLVIAAVPSLFVASAAIAMLNIVLGVASFAAIFGWQALWPAGERGAGNAAFMATITLVGVGAGPLLTGVMSEAGGGGGAALARALVVTGIAAAAVASGVALILNRRRAPGLALA